jgi:hypothetical protein
MTTITSVTQVHRTTGDGYSVAVWHVGDHYVIQATADAFMPSRLLRPSEERSTYGEAEDLWEDWVREYQRAAGRARVEAELAKGNAVIMGSF